MMDTQLCKRVSDKSIYLKNIYILTNPDGFCFVLFLYFPSFSGKNANDNEKDNGHLLQLCSNVEFSSISPR